MFRKKQSGTQRLVSMLGAAVERPAAGTMKAVGAVGSVALATVGASALINTLRRREEEGAPQGESG